MFSFDSDVRDLIVITQRHNLCFVALILASFPSVYQNNDSAALTDKSSMKLKELSFKLTLSDRRTEVM